MLQLDRPDRPLSKASMHTPGGFAWWYADAIDHAGDGFVCIWSYGLPFLPGLASRDRAGSPTPPLTRPSINLVTYNAGKPTSYTLQELSAHSEPHEGCTWRFGGCQFQLSTSGQQRTLRAELHLPSPGGAPITGTFTIRGVASQPSGPAPDEPHHLWTPLLGAATADASLRSGETPLLELRDASGYHDRNGGTAPLHRLGLSRWLWGRHTLGGDQVVWYLSYPSDAGVEPLLWLHRTRPDGTSTLRRVEARRTEERRTWLGLRWWSRVEIDDGEAPITIHLDPPCDSGPFYLRMQAVAQQGTHRSRGWAELCEPSRIDAAWSRPLVQMCVIPPEGTGSRWLPLFSGQVSTRWSRLARWWSRPALTGPSAREVAP